MLSLLKGCAAALFGTAQGRLVSLRVIVAMAWACAGPVSVRAAFGVRSRDRQGEDTWLQ